MLLILVLVRVLLMVEIGFEDEEWRMGRVRVRVSFCRGCICEE